MRFMQAMVVPLFSSPKMSQTIVIVMLSYHSSFSELAGGDPLPHDATFVIVTGKNESRMKKRFFQEFKQISQYHIILFCGRKPLIFLKM